MGVIIINRYRLIWISIIIMFIAYVIFAFPIKIDKELPAVKYRLGKEDIIENINIKIEGHYYRRLFSDDYFVGSIYIDGYKFTNESSGFENLKSTLTNIYFNKKGYGMYQYIKNSTGSIQRLMQGEIFIKDKFSILSMTIMEKANPNSSRSGWNSENGLMISAPAETREEALDISNFLMTDFLRSNPLE